MNKWIVTMKDGTMYTLIHKECDRLNNAFMDNEPRVEITPMGTDEAVEIDIEMIKDVTRVIPQKSCENCVHKFDEHCFWDEKRRVARFQGFCDDWQIMKGYE